MPGFACEMKALQWEERFEIEKSAVSIERFKNLNPL